MFRIAICDDEPKEQSIARAMCEKFFADNTDEPFDIALFDNPMDMLVDIEKEKVFDLLLCDVYTPGLLGTDAIQELRDARDETHVIFLTTSRDHAVDAFALHADNYLVKPYSYEQFGEAIHAVVDMVQNERKAAVPIRSREGLCRLEFNDFVYAETADHDQIIHLRDGGTLTTRSSSQTLFDRLLGDSRFFKAGSSFIINLDNVRGIEGHEVALATKEKIRVPTRCRKALTDAFFERSFTESF